ncbi:MAG: hypothetical protein SGILL_004533 [Bacillariaceae sp.]
MAWRILKKRFEPDDTLALIEVQALKAKAVMANAKEDPSVMFQKLEEVRAEYTRISYPITEAELILQAQVGAHADYEEIILRAMDKADLTLETLEADMRRKFRLHQVMKGSNNDKEMSLVAFNGNCNKCGKQGHKAKDCKSNNNNNGNNGNGKKRFAGKCNGCGKQGHKLADCWLSEENKSKRPEWLQKKLDKEVAAVATSNNGAEVMLMGREVVFNQNEMSKSDRPEWWCQTCNYGSNKSPQQFIFELEAMAKENQSEDSIDDDDSYFDDDDSLPPLNSNETIDSDETSYDVRDSDDDDDDSVPSLISRRKTIDSKDDDDDTIDSDDMPALISRVEAVDTDDEESVDDMPALIGRTGCTETDGDGIADSFFDHFTWSSDRVYDEDDDNLDIAKPSLIVDDENMPKDHALMSQEMCMLGTLGQFEFMDKVTMPPDSN